MLQLDVRNLSLWRRRLVNAYEVDKCCLLFLIFINDLDLNINSSVFKFADDTKIIGTVKDSTDSERLQADVDTLYQWAGTWQMKFNISNAR